MFFHLKSKTKHTENAQTKEGHNAGGDANLSEEFTLLQKSAEQGDTEAQYNLGLLYLEGNGVKKNEKIAVQWFQKAADQGHKEAMKKLSWCYLYGRGVKQSLSYALELSQKADGTEEKVDMNKYGALVRK